MKPAILVVKTMPPAAMATKPTAISPNINHGMPPLTFRRGAGYGAGYWVP